MCVCVCVCLSVSIYRVRIHVQWVHKTWCIASSKSNTSILMLLCVAVPVKEEIYDPAKEELIVPRMPIFYGKKRRNNQGIKHAVSTKHVYRMINHKIMHKGIKECNSDTITMWHGRLVAYGKSTFNRHFLQSCRGCGLPHAMKLASTVSPTKFFSLVWPRKVRRQVPFSTDHSLSSLSVELRGKNREDDAARELNQEHIYTRNAVKKMVDPRLNSSI